MASSIPAKETAGFFILSRHASKRMRQRGITLEAVLASIAFGIREYSHGICFIWLRRRDIPEKSGAALDRFQGVIVLLAGNEVVTVYRARRGRGIGRAGRRWWSR